MSSNITVKALSRLPQYLSFLKTLPNDKEANISATAIAQKLGLNDVQVRKDLAAVSTGGKPKVGYNVMSLIDDIEKYLGFKDGFRRRYSRRRKSRQSAFILWRL